MKYIGLVTLFAFNMIWSQQKDSTLLRSNFEAKKIIIPSTLIAAGTLVLTTEKRDVPVTENKNFLAFGGFFEDYAQFSPHAAVFAFEWVGMKPKTNFWNRSAILAKSQLMVLGSTFILKHTFKQPRPDGSNKYGFPSGHTATAFSGAEMLSMEYKENYPWVPYVAYTMATGVGILRVTHKKHYWSDVLVGAGLGILSTKIAYWTHQYRWNKKSDKDPLTNLYKAYPSNSR